MKLAVFDTETTGLDTERDEIIDLCICIWDNGVQAPWYRKRFLPIGPCEPGAARVNGYDPATWGRTEYAPGRLPGYFTAADADEIGAFLSQGEFLCGAATHFDVAMLKSAFKRVRVPWPATISHRVVDVHSIAHPLLLAGKITSVSLGALAKHFGLGDVPHTAPGDVTLTMQVYEKLIETYWPVLDGVAA